MRLLAVLLLLVAPQETDLKSAFEARRAQDPVAAFKQLAASPGEPARAVARPALARQIAEDAAAGLKAWTEGKAEPAEKHLARAALLADPYAPELSRQLMRLVFLLKPPRKAPPECGACKNAGASACTACQQKGEIDGPCPRCEAKGSIACILCDGSGTLDHHGYKGTLVLTVERDTRVTFTNDDGKTLRGTLPAQSLTYQMATCAAGSFSLQTESVVRKTGAKKTDSASQPCEKFWKQMKMFVFSGKAKIKVNNDKGQLTPISSTSARRFFADYESCKGGHVACDRCEGKKTDPCSRCRGKGQSPLLCGTCEGAAVAPCGACKGYGQAIWLRTLLPEAPALSQSLQERAAALKRWLDDRARAIHRKEDLAQRLADAKKGVDPTAKFSPDVVDVKCATCTGRGGSCEACWGAGRREFAFGTPQHDRYALIDRVNRQLAEAAKAAPALPVFGALPETEAAPAAVAGAPRPAPAPAPLVPPVMAVAVPATIDEMIRKADELHAAGKEHLEKSKASGDNAVWIEEGLKAVGALRNAQMLYATAQEKLDELGATVPRELLQKFRTNMQALVMARKQVP